MQSFYFIISRSHDTPESSCFEGLKKSEEGPATRRSKAPCDETLRTLILNPNPQTPNPKPSTLNPRP